METTGVFQFWGLNQGTFSDGGREAERLDLACCMFLMLVFIFIFIGSCIFDLEEGLSNYSNWSLPEKLLRIPSILLFLFSVCMSCHNDSRL